jgi:ribonuclease Z
MSDTCYNEMYLEKVKGVDLLYHEATFLDDLKERAKETFHTTCIQAGEFASKAGVGKLVIGHFSSRYRELAPMLTEARSSFNNTYLALEGETFSVSDE